MKEELTTAMHSEFSVDAEVQLKHRCWAAERQMADAETDDERARILASYEITAEEFDVYGGSWADDDDD